MIMENIERKPDFMQNLIPRAKDENQQGSDSINEVLAEWKQYIVASFKKMPRKRQEKLLEKNSVVVCAGMSVTIINLVYRSLPLLLRVFGTAAIIFGSYVFAKRWLTPLLIQEFKEHLNPDCQKTEET